MAQYISGKKKASKPRTDLILDTIHEVGRELIGGVMIEESPAGKFLADDYQINGLGFFSWINKSTIKLDSYL